MENLLPNKENFSEKPLDVLWDFRLCALVCSFPIVVVGLSINS